MDNVNIIWNNCLQIIKGGMNRSSFETWFTPIVPLKVENNTLTLQVPSAFFYEYLEGNYIELLRSALHQVLGMEAKLEYSIIVDGGRPKPQPVQRQAADSQQRFYQNPGAYRVPSQGNGTQSPVNVDPRGFHGQEIPNNPFVITGIQRQTINSQLNPNYTMDNFVSGKCNQLGFSAAETIAKNPNRNQFNPFLIFGGSGLGKTHLAQAIGNAIKERYSEKVVVYVEANKFQTQYSDACRNNTRNDFMHFYQMLDVLIIDDVQEFAGKQGTQDTFFAIFNSLHQAGKQIILTCDTMPAELKGLAERLLTRFRWGLTVELSTPDYETRLQILQRKCYNDGAEISLDILKYIAQTVVSNVRELEGALLSLFLHTTVMREELTLDVAKQLLSKIVKGGTEPKYKIEHIMRCVCEYFNIKENVINSKSRAREIVVARQMVMYFAKQLTELPYQQIGIAIGGRDHSTVLHACKAVQQKIDGDAEFKQMAADIENKIRTEYEG